MRKLSVPGFTIVVMEQMTYVGGWVDRIDDMAVNMTDQSLRTG